MLENPTKEEKKKAEELTEKIKKICKEYKMFLLPSFTIFGKEIKSNISIVSERQMKEGNK